MSLALFPNKAKPFERYPSLNADAPSVIFFALFMTVHMHLTTLLSNDLCVFNNDTANLIKLQVESRQTPIYLSLSNI